MRDRRLSRACLSEKHKTTFRVGVGVVHPLDNEVQECYACSHETTPVGPKSRVESIWDFSDFCIEFYDNYQIGNPEAIKDYLPASETLVDIFSNSSRIRNAAISVEMVAWFKKVCRSSTRTSDNCLIFSSGPPPIFFNLRFPEITS